MAITCNHSCFDTSATGCPGDDWSSVWRVKPLGLTHEDLNGNCSILGSRFSLTLFPGLVKLLDELPRPGLNSLTVSDRTRRLPG